VSKQIIIPVVLAGGIGTRLWPLSREQASKQFLRLTGKQSMLQYTVQRLLNLPHTTPPIITCNKDHQFLVRGQMRELSLEYRTIFLEPIGRGTGPAALIACLETLSDNIDPLVLIVPADHVIQNEAEFGAALEVGVTSAEAGYLVTFGVLPTRTESGYGYIQRGQELQPGVFQLASFVEKPNLSAATDYGKDSRWFWNSGMFLFKANQYIEEAKQYQPEMFACCRQALEESENAHGCVHIPQSSLTQCDSGSIDTMIMEKTTKGVLVPLDAMWSDVGSWKAMWEINKPDSNGNVVHGDAITRNTSNTLVYADHKLIATVGVENLVIVDSSDALLVCHLDKAQEVQDVVASLKSDNREEYRQHRKVDRPWGTYETVDAGEEFRVKRITVYPGCRLSLQSHSKRAEHWIVVSGCAQVTRGREQFALSKNESTYIPANTKHRLENSGQTNLVLVEVQTGSYLEEDDIVRYEDDFDRQSGDF